MRPLGARRSRTPGPFSRWGTTPSCCCPAGERARCGPSRTPAGLILLLRHGPPPIAADTVAIRVAPVLPGQSELAVIAGLGEPGLAHSGTLAELMAGHRMCSGRDQPAGLFRPVPLTPRTVHRVRFTRPARHPHHFGSLLGAGYLDQSTSAE
jgi:hypothetical protein